MSGWRATAACSKNMASTCSSFLCRAIRLAVAALLAGEIDAAIVGPGHLVNAGLSGADVIGIANFNQKLDFRLNTRPEIKKPEDLHGKRIAISGPGSTSHLVTMLSLQGLNVDPIQAKIAFLTIPGTEMNRRLALESGSVDATTLRGAMGDLYANKGYTLLYNLKAAGVTLPQNMMVTTRRTAATKPAGDRRLLESDHRGDRDDQRSRKQGTRESAFGLEPALEQSGRCRGVLSGRDFQL